MLDFRIAARPEASGPAAAPTEPAETAGRVAHVVAQFAAARGSYGTAREVWQPGGSGRSPKS